MGTGACVAVAVGDCIGSTSTTIAATGVCVGTDAGAFRAALVGAAGVGRGVSMGVGAGASVVSSPQATASTMITVNAKATSLTCESPVSHAEWAGCSDPPHRPHLPIRLRASLSPLRLSDAIDPPRDRAVKKQPFQVMRNCLYRAVVIGMGSAVPFGLTS